MYGSLDISTSGMVAQRTRMEAISANIANSRTLLNAQGEYDPYRRREVMFAPGDPSSRGDAAKLGVHVAEININQDALRAEYDPSSPFDFDKDGYIQVPDIHPVVEQINALETARAYEANVTAAETTKSMMSQALRLIG